MKSALALLASIVCIFFATNAAEAQNYDELFRNFRADELTHADKRFLQAALAFEGEYIGLLDGDWGQLSEQAFERYSLREFGARAETWHMAILAFSLFERIESDGWNQKYFPELGISFLFPEDAYIVDPPSVNLSNWRHSKSSLSISAGRLSRQSAERVHAYALDWHDAPSKIYSMRKTNIAVTSARKYDGSQLYVRSDFVLGAWSTVLLSAKQNDFTILNAVSASIEKGATGPIFFSKNGRLDHAIQMTIEALNSDDENDSSSNDEQERGSGANSGSGTGFIVSKDGHVITNAHVVAGCDTLLIDGALARLVEENSEFDLALLISNSLNGRSVATFSPVPAKLNSDVTVVGYPYAGLLGGLNVTRGSVSALTGINGDTQKMQISAPIQSGNSGGPILAADGDVVGVVVSKLDALEVAGVLGDLPQNANYGVRGEIAKLFLSQNGVHPVVSYFDTSLSPEVIAEKAAKFTVFVECK